MEPVRGGKLALVNNEIKDMFKSKKPNMSVASWAMGFVASHKNIITILSGMNSEQQMLDNLSTLTDFKAFGDDEYSICFKAVSILNKSEVIGCTGCDYCQPCPRVLKSVRFSHFITVLFQVMLTFSRVEKYMIHLLLILLLAPGAINAKIIARNL